MIAIHEQFSDAPKLCRDCMYCKPAQADYDDDIYKLAVCVRAPMRNDLVAGGRTHPFCVNERENESGCGSAGRNFQPNTKQSK